MQEYSLLFVKQILIFKESGMTNANEKRKELKQIELFQK
jgi:hypothetical protein